MTVGVAAVRSINRYELKYLADPARVRGLHTEIAALLDRDPEATGATYPLWSVYYDTADLRCYWEKIDGLKFRRKLRIRHYGEADTLQADTPVYVEIKQRFNRVTQKRRIRLPYSAAQRLCAGHDTPEVTDGQESLADEVVRFVDELDLRPTAIVGYRREAFVGRGADAGLRLTIDREVRGRMSVPELHVAGDHRFAVRPDLAVVEIKVNEQVPYWLSGVVARLQLQTVRISKYCATVEAVRNSSPFAAAHSNSGAEDIPTSTHLSEESPS